MFGMLWKMIPWQFKAFMAFAFCLGIGFWAFIAWGVVTVASDPGAAANAVGRTAADIETGYQAGKTSD